jgi:hypothetical protein
VSRGLVRYAVVSGARTEVYDAIMKTGQMAVMGGSEQAGGRHGRN